MACISTIERQVTKMDIHIIPLIVSVIALTVSVMRTVSDIRKGR